jgi:RNA recognition motif-containing protein
MGKKLYVGNISFKATEEHLREFFANVGEVESVRMVVVPHTGQPKGFAFVEMVEEGDARRAIAELNGKPFMGRDLRVSDARPPKTSAESGRTFLRERSARRER